MLVNTARVVGPAIAGVLLALTSEAVCFALNALSFVAVIVAILQDALARRVRPARRVRLVGELVEGVRYASASSRCARCWCWWPRWRGRSRRTRR